MPSRTPTTSLNFASSAATIRSHAHTSIRPAEMALPCTEAMVILRKSRHRRMFSKYEVPLLQIEFFDQRRLGRAMRTEGGVLVRAGCALQDRFLGAQIVSSGKVPPTRGQDHHPYIIVGLGAAERVVQLHQEGARLSVLRLRSIEPDPGDASIVEGLVSHLVSVCHGLHIRAASVPATRA